MKFFSKLALVSFLSTLVLSFVSVSSADVAPASTPLVYVQHITLNSVNYKAGDTVTGSFVLANKRADSVSNVVYKISLAGNYGKNGLAGVFYDSMSIDSPLFLNGNESKTVSFSYTLPPTISGTHLGIQIQAFLKSGQPFTWSDAFINVTGGTGFAAVSTAGVQTGDFVYDLQAGPTVHSGQPVFLNASLFNPTKVAMTLTPTLTIYNGSLTGSLLTTEKESALAIKPSATSSVHINLPTFDNTPGVYVGKLDFVDGSGAIKAASVEFRYIIEGPIISVRSINSDHETVYQGEKFGVMVIYTGTPSDISTGQIATSSADNVADLHLRIINEKGLTVADTTTKINVGISTSTTFALTSLVDAHLMQADVSVTQNGKVINSYSAGLTGTNAVFTPKPVFNYKILIAPAVVVVIIIGLILLVIIRRKKVSSFVYVFLGTAIISGFILGNHAFANYTQVAETHFDYSTVINQDDIIINPVNQTDGTDTLAPGQSFTISGQANATACFNGLQKVKYYASDPYLASSYNAGHSYTTTVTDNNSAGVCQSGQNDCGGVYVNTDQFSLGTFTAPVTPGHYIMNFQLKDVINRTDDLPYYDNNTSPTCDIDNFAFIDKNSPSDNGEAHAHNCPVNYLQNVNQGYVVFDVTSASAPKCTVTCSPNPTAVDLSNQN